MQSIHRKLSPKLTESCKHELDKCNVHWNTLLCIYGNWYSRRKKKNGEKELLLNFCFDVSWSYLFWMLKIHFEGFSWAKLCASINLHILCVRVKVQKMTLFLRAKKMKLNNFVGTCRGKLNLLNEIWTIVLRIFPLVW